MLGAIGLGAAAAAAATVFSSGIYYFAFRRGFARARRTGIVKSYEMDAENPLCKYLLEHNLEDPALSRLRKFTLTLPHGSMMSPVEEGNLLTILCKAIDARKVIDVGVFTGCSAYAMALGLPASGKVIACDMDGETAMKGKPYWEEGGVAAKIDLRIKPATETLQELIDNGEDGSFDMVFIDADKTNYPNYYRFALQLLRPGGLIVVDNALGFGRMKVYDSSCTGVDIEGIRTINRMMKDDERVVFVLLDISSGVGIGLKK